MAKGSDKGSGWKNGPNGPKGLGVPGHKNKGWCPSGGKHKAGGGSGK